MFHHFVSSQQTNKNPVCSKTSSYADYFTPNFQSIEDPFNEKLIKSNIDRFSIDKENSQPNQDRFERLLVLYEE